MNSAAHTKQNNKSKNGRKDTKRIIQRADKEQHIKPSPARELDSTWRDTARRPRDTIINSNNDRYIPTLNTYSINFDNNPISFPAPALSCSTAGDARPARCPATPRRTPAAPRPPRPPRRPRPPARPRQALAPRSAAGNPLREDADDMHGLM